MPRLGTPSRTDVSQNEADARLGIINGLLYEFMESKQDERAPEFLKKINRVTEGRCTDCGRPAHDNRVSEFSAWGVCDRCLS
jgi:hypothetical protein